MSSTQTALPELQQAIYTVLSGDATLTGMIQAVIDEGAITENQAFPYVAIGDGSELPTNTFAKRGYTTTLMLHIWSKALGFNEAYTILARLNHLIDQQSLNLPTQQHVLASFDQTIAMNDPADMITLRHLAVRYKFFSQEQ